MDQVLPAYRRLKHFLHEEYLPNTRRHIGISSLPSGGSYYSDVIKWHSGLDLAPSDLHTLGQQLVAHTRLKIDQVLICSL